MARRILSVADIRAPRKASLWPKLPQSPHRWNSQQSHNVAKRMARLLAALLVGGICGVTNIQQVFASVTITLNYVQVAVEEFPERKSYRWQQTRVYTLNINGGNKIIAKELSGNGTFHFDENGVGSTSDGQQYKTIFRILNGTIFIITDYEEYVTIRKIKTDGIAVCDSSLDFKKKPGRQYFIVHRGGSTIYYSDRHIENLSCVISQASG